VEEVIIPYPKQEAKLKKTETAIETAIIGRAKLREKVAHAADGVDSWLSGECDGPRGARVAGFGAKIF
jgi:hypothetical protein